jgi:phosphopantetheinyl transferase
MLATNPEDMGLRHGTVDVWPMPLGGSAERHLRVLSPTELARFGRRRGAQARRFAVAHGTMREVLGRYLDCAPRDVPVSARYGEPPQTAGLRVSLSHSEDLGLLAVSQSAVGIDIEDVVASDDRDLADVAELTLSSRELALLGHTSELERPRAWLRFWTRREAVLKAKPDALAGRAISELDVSRDTVLDLSVEDLNLGPQYVAAVASGLTEPNVAWRELADEQR